MALAEPAPDPLLFTRFLLTAEATGQPVIPVLSKADLVPQQEVVAWRQRLALWGYDAMPLRLGPDGARRRSGGAFAAGGVGHEGGGTYAGLSLLQAQARALQRQQHQPQFQHHPLAPAGAPMQVLYLGGPPHLGALQPHAQLQAGGMQPGPRGLPPPQGVPQPAQQQQLYSPQQPACTQPPGVMLLPGGGGAGPLQLIQAGGYGAEVPLQPAPGAMMAPAQLPLDGAGQSYGFYYAAAPPGADAKPPGGGVAALLQPIDPAQYGAAQGGYQLLSAPPAGGAAYQLQYHQQQQQQQQQFMWAASQQQQLLPLGAGAVPAAYPPGAPGPPGPGGYYFPGVSGGT
jgi:hypothetical protein